MARSRNMLWITEHSKAERVRLTEYCPFIFCRWQFCRVLEWLVWKAESLIPLNSRIEGTHLHSNMAITINIVPFDGIYRELEFLLLISVEVQSGFRCFYFLKTLTDLANIMVTTKSRFIMNFWEFYHLKSWLWYLKIHVCKTEYYFI